MANQFQNFEKDWKCLNFLPQEEKTDLFNQIKRFKGYFPELNYKFRKEILSEIKGVKKIVPANWIITQKFLDKHKIDILISGGDYKDRKFKTKTINFNRTKSISSTILRKKATKILKNLYEK